MTPKRCLIPLAAILLVGLSSCGRSERGAATATPLKSIKTRTGVEMVLVPGGWFQMGSDHGQPDEAPAHKVWVDSFLMDRFEVTNALYDLVDQAEVESKDFDYLPLGNPSHWKGPQHPVEQMSWSRAALFCNKRSLLEGLEPCYDIESGKCNFEANGYRLPTEAEWEYACRAGTTTPYPFGSDPRLLKSYAWYAANSGKRTHPVGLKKPNLWGLYDMLGNVAEWCNDPYSKDYYRHSPERNPRGPAEGERYVVRGGAWTSSAEACRSAYRVGEDPGFEDACFARDALGFRCVRKVPPDLLPGNR